MKCCMECFRDVEIRAMIEGLRRKGRCEVCGKEDVFLYDTERDDLLRDPFEELLAIYSPAEDLPADFPEDKLGYLSDILYDEWKVFSTNLPKDQASDLLQQICAEKYRDMPKLFQDRVGISEMVNRDVIQKMSLLKGHEWMDFAQAIKTENRFHTDYINRAVLEDFCINLLKEYPAGTVFYRARIGDAGGFSKNQMSAPPAGQAKDGRANPHGISCLYVCDRPVTAMHEIRAAEYDYVVIAKFELQEDIKIVDLSLLDQISPFHDNWDCFKLAINKAQLRNIARDLAKPMRRNDSPLDYLPTQYISEFVKSLRDLDGRRLAHGIGYGSVMYRGGYNIAFFDPGIFRCKGDPKRYEVRVLNYECTPKLRE